MYALLQRNQEFQETGVISAFPWGLAISHLQFPGLLSDMQFSQS